MSKIGDLFVRLGLKKDEFSKGIKDAKRESSSFVDSLKSIGTKGKLAFAAVGAAIAGVVAAVKDLAKQNQSLGDEIRKTGAGLSAMWDTLKTSIASLDFSNLIGNLREANRLARDLYDAQDALGEIGTSYNISLAQQLQHINELKIALRDQTLKDDERIAKGEELLRIYKALEQNPGRGLEKLKDTTLDYYMQRMGVQMEGRTDAELAAMRKKYVEFFKWLGTAEGEAYNAAAKKVAQQLGGLDGSKLGMNFMQNAANNGRAEYARLAVSYNDKIGDKDREKIEQAVVAYYQQQAKYSGETLRIQTQINSIKAKGQTGSGTGEDEGAAIQRIKDSTKTQAELLRQRYDEQRALLVKHGEDTTALTEKFQQDLVKAFSGKAEEGNLLESVMDPTEVVQKHYDEILAIMQQYNLDTTALTSKHIALMGDAQAEEEAAMQEEQQALDEWSRTWIEEFAKVNNLSLDPIMDELHQLTERTLTEVELQEQAMERARELSEEFKEAIIEGFSAGCQELTDQLFGLKEVNAGAIFQALLEPLADLAIRQGEILMAEGIGVEACKAALESLNGYAAIAAGAALIAIGAAAKSGLQALASTGGRSTSVSTYNGSAGSAGSQTIETELTVNVKGTIRGSDIVLSGQKTVNAWGR